MTGIMIDCTIRSPRLLPSARSFLGITAIRCWTWRMASGLAEVIWSTTRTIRSPSAIVSAHVGVPRPLFWASKDFALALGCTV